MTLNVAELFLKKNLDAAVAAIQTAGGKPIVELHCDEFDEPEVFETTHKAAAEARQIDAMLRYVVRDDTRKVTGFAFAVIYDGPYTKDNAEEIIYDCNAAADELMTKVAANV